MSSYKKLSTNLSAYIQQVDPDRPMTAEGYVDIAGLEKNGNKKAVLVFFDRVEDNLKFKKLTTSSEFTMFFKRNDSNNHSYYMIPLKNTFTSAVTWNTRPDTDDTFRFNSASIKWFDDYQDPNTGYAEPKFSGLEAFVTTYKNGLMISSDDAEYLMVRANPELSLFFLDEDVTPGIGYLSPSSGSVPKNIAHRFSWDARPDGYCLGEIPQISSTFYWRDGTSGAYTAVSCGTDKFCDIPANTFTEDEMQWYVSATFQVGDTTTTVTSDVCTLSTNDTTSTAIIIDPKNTTIDGTSANTFMWQHIISSGTAQTKADLQQSEDGVTWASLATVIGSATSKTIPANTFASGQHFWRVRTYNADDVAGEWSEPALISVVSAPTVPVVTATATPKPTVSWQASDQQAYNITVDNSYDSGIVFGTANSMVLPFYLDDGQHTISVRVQNAHGMWSNFGEVSINVENTAGASLELTANVNNDVVSLAWTERSSYAFFIVYRDNVPIAKVTEYQYTDLFSIGAHSYKIRGIYSGSMNYGISNTVSVLLKTESTVLYDIESGTSMNLTLSASSMQEVQISETAISVLTHITASAYPMVERSKFRDKIINFAVAFRADDPARDSLESMLGKIVCVKTARGTSVTGALDMLGRSDNVFYVSYQCSVQQIAYEEEIPI